MKKMITRKWVLKISLLVIAIMLLVVIIPLGWIFTAGLRPPVKATPPEYWPTEGWQSSTLEAQGFSSAKLARGLLSLKENGAAIDNLLIIRNGSIVLNAHFSPYDGSFPHDLASVTKSMTTTLIAIAAEHGYLDLDQTMVSFFPERTIGNMDERKQRITVRHLAGMVNGMESLCFDGDEPTLDAMRSQSDWVQAALDRPMMEEPGAENCYDSPGMHILSAILQKATGMTELEFGQKYLFEPLGINHVIWETDPQGYTHGWGDLHLLPEDAAKIGFLWLQRGHWDGKQIVSEAWVLDSVKAQSKFVDGDFGYGYGWWVAWQDYLASGRGGQMIRVINSLNTVLVVNGSNFEYSEVEKWLLPMLVTLKDSLPADPKGEAELVAALEEIQRDPFQESDYPASELAAEVSGKQYNCSDNPARIEKVLFDFQSAEADLLVSLGGEEETIVIGLDGDYRFTAEGGAYRGYWEDEKTFYFEGFDIDRIQRRVVYEEDRLEASLVEVGMDISCQQEN